MQTLTDWGYSEHGADRENEFVVAGPGAVKGAAVLDPTATPLDVIKRMHVELQLERDVPQLYGRVPSYMDVQNTLCELSKYVRFTDRGKAYVPAHPGVQPEPTLPSHWRNRA
jgi:hypothetical protein